MSPKISDDELLQQAQHLIAELRNRRNVDRNWPSFRDLIEGNLSRVLDTFSSRWLISVCDTYVDFGGPIQSRNALLISLLVSLGRLSDSLYEDRDIRPERVEQLNNGWPPQYDGLQSLHLQRQDTLLNLAKRLTRSLMGDPIMHPIYLTILRRVKENDTLISRFAKRSTKPEWVLPEQPLGIIDNYGLK